MKHRPEIDGLRAVAVVPVVLHHTQPGLLPGGAAGVDVFFVISGFLITQILLQDLQSGTWSLTRFYQRRARRIFPALFAMLAASLLAAWVILLPYQMFAHAKASLAAIFFVSNFVFLEKVNYFSDGPETNPLIHTWSLGVEEQYYILFPVLLLGLWRLARPHTRVLTLRTGLAAVLVLSFAVTLWGMGYSTEKNFFFTPSRIWELLAGALAGHYVFHRQAAVPLGHAPLGHTQFGQAIAALGLVMVLASFVFLNAKTPFPSGWTILPVLGAALLLVFATDRGPIGRLLTAPPVLGVGLISYSLYLWHQPMLAFWRLLHPDASGLALWAVAAAAVPVAWASWRYIERPFRTGRYGWPAVSGYFAAKAGGMVALCAAVLVLHPMTPAFHRLDAGQKQIVPFIDARLDQTDLYLQGTCFVDGPFPDPTACRPPMGQATKVLVWGDSHAAGLAVGMRARVPGFAGYGIMRCPIFVADGTPMSKACDQALRQVTEQIAQAQPDLILLHRNWESNLEEIAVLDQTIAKLHRLAPKARIILLGAVPKWQVGLPEHLIEAATPIEAGLHLPTDLRALRAADQALKAVAENAGVQFVAPIDLLCKGNTCLAIAALPDGRLEPTAFDYGHMTEAGSRHLTHLLAPVLGLTLN